jgi:hypothetical protein
MTFKSWVKSKSQTSGFSHRVTLTVCKKVFKGIFKMMKIRSDFKKKKRMKQMFAMGCLKYIIRQTFNINHNRSNLPF